MLLGLTKKKFELDFEYDYVSLMQLLKVCHGLKKYFSKGRNVAQSGRTGHGVVGSTLGCHLLLCSIIE
jgi:hypothetical protein